MEASKAGLTRSKKALLIGITIILVIIGIYALWPADPNRIVANEPLPAKTYLIGEGPMVSELKLEIATSDEEQRRGLMARDTVRFDGMAFPIANKPVGFWMRGTKIPLDVIYVGRDSRVLNIMPGKPNDEANLPSSGPVKMVIEVPAGRAKLYGLKVGALVKEAPANKPPAG